MSQATTLDKFKVPLGNQEIELQEIIHAEGGIGLLRIRIREGRRFTIFDIDPATARHWSDVMKNWAQGQAGAK